MCFVIFVKITKVYLINSPTYFTRETIFVTSCLLSCASSLSSQGSKSLFLHQLLLQKGDKTNLQSCHLLNSWNTAMNVSISVNGECFRERTKIYTSTVTVVLDTRTPSLHCFPNVRDSD